MDWIDDGPRPPLVDDELLRQSPALVAAWLEVRRAISVRRAAFSAFAVDMKDEAAADGLLDALVREDAAVHEFTGLFSLARGRVAGHC